MKKVGQLFRENLVNQVTEGIDKNSSVFVFNYSRVSSFQLGELRKKMKQAGADVYVSKNAIAQIALKNLKHDVLAERINGQTAFVWGSADSAQISKILVGFAKECEHVKLQGGLLDGKILEQNDIKRLSDLPSREVLLGQLLGTIQAPITRLMYCLNAKSIDLLSILKQYSEKKGGN